MPTTSQLVRKGRKPKARRGNSVALQQNPQKRGTVTRVMVINPKKPNSANRHCVRVKLSNKKEVTALVPGRGMGGIQEHSNVLVRGGRTPDLPGVRYKVIRGTLDARGADDERSQEKGSNGTPRKTSRSKYGVKRAK